MLATPMPGLTRIHPSWDNFFDCETAKPYFADLTTFLTQERLAGKAIFPPEDLIFNAFHHTALDDVKVVILGQDPYHGAGQAMGLSFAVPPGVKIPPSLRNIYKELADNPGITPPVNGDLTGWAKQGVLLLNTILTVEEAKAHAHAKSGWALFTDAVIARVAARGDVVFLLWGAHAQKKSALIDAAHNTILETTHPSPLSAYRGFLGSGCFVSCNEALTASGRLGIIWK